MVNLGEPTAQLILRLLVEDPRSFADLLRLTGRSRRAVYRALDFLEKLQCVQKGNLPKPTKRDLWHITDRGIIICKAGLIHLSKHRLNLYTADMIVEKPHVRSHLKPPRATVLFYSDRLTEKQLKDMLEADQTFRLVLQQKITEVRDAYIQKHKPAILTGYVALDRDRLDPTEDLGQDGFHEKDCQKRHVTWLRESHDLLFGVIFEFNGHDWVKANDESGVWEELKKWARRTDLTVWKNVEENREYVRSHPLEVQARKGATSRYLVLDKAASLEEEWSEYKRKHDALSYQGFYFSPENVSHEVWSGDEPTMRRLIQEKKIEIKEDKIYRIAPTPEGLNELKQMREEQRRNLKPLAERSFIKELS